MGRLHVRFAANLTIADMPTRMPRIGYSESKDGIWRWPNPPRRSAIVIRPTGSDAAPDCSDAAAPGGWIAGLRQQPEDGKLSHRADIDLAVGDRAER